MSNANEYAAIAKWLDVFYPKKDDLEFYESLATPGLPVLELGCGTGRVSCILATRGHRVLGIDACSEMIEAALLKKAQLSKPADGWLDFRRLDAVNFDFREEFPSGFGLIVAPWGVVLEFQSRERRLSAYRSCLRNLAATGLLAFDNWFHGTGNLANWGSQQRPDGCLMLDGIAQHPEIENGKVYCFVVRKHVDDRQSEVIVIVDEVLATGALQRNVARITQIYVSPEETEAELKEAGFSQVEVFGGFDRHPLYDPSLQGRGRQVFIARP